MHREWIADTAKIIQKHILIPQLSYKDHLRWSANDTVHLLSHIQNCLLPDGPKSTKSALLQIAIILNRDIPPTIPPLQSSPKNISTSKEENYYSKISSEGGNITDNTPVDDVVKKTITCGNWQALMLNLWVGKG